VNGKGVPKSSEVQEPELMITESQRARGKKFMRPPSHPQSLNSRVVTCAGLFVSPRGKRPVTEKERQAKRVKNWDEICLDSA